MRRRQIYDKVLQHRPMTDELHNTECGVLPDVFQIHMAVCQTKRVLPQGMCVSARRVATAQ
jgi:hypothetical protein